MLIGALSFFSTIMVVLFADSFYFSRCS